VKVDKFLSKIYFSPFFHHYFISSYRNPGACHYKVKFNIFYSFFIINYQLFSYFILYYC
jgi:hypothetical protein